jgi:ketosteroid isomerase-like protein
MKRSVIVPVLAVCGLLVSGCGQAETKPLSAEEKAAIAGAVEQRVAGYLDAIQRLDLDWILGFWADVDGYVFAGDGELTAGYETHAGQLREDVAGIATINSIVKSNEHIYVLAKDAASYSMEFEWSMTMAAGDTVRSHGAWTYVFKRLDGEWKVVHSGGTHVYF